MSNIENGKKQELLDKVKMTFRQNGADYTIENLNKLPELIKKIEKTA